ncbi:MAG: DUF2946 family protein [Sterolibacteriaceae bacterium]|nr:DUF2946 family protein [Sterolibacteriaceae bacterium]
MTSPDAAIPAVKWPNVPACYGWLSLDRRGNWRLKGEVVRHAGLIAFINRNYAADENGNRVFHNGPQKVYVDLDYAPLVLRLGIDGELTAHTGMPAGEASAAFIDEEGNALLLVAAGIGLLDDRDLPAFLATCRDANGITASDAALIESMQGGSGLWWRGLPLQPIRRDDLPRRFGFRPDPAA